MLVHAVQAAHQEADLLERGVGGRERAGQHADVDHRQAVGERQQLVQVLRDHQHRGAGAGEVEQRLMDRGGGAGVDPPGRLRDHQHARVLQDLAADDELLQIAAGERARGRGRRSAS